MATFSANLAVPMTDDKKMYGFQTALDQWLLEGQIERPFQFLELQCGGCFDQLMLTKTQFERKDRSACRG